MISTRWFDNLFILSVPFILCTDTGHKSSPINDPAGSFTIPIRYAHGLSVPQTIRKYFGTECETTLGFGHRNQLRLRGGNRMDKKRARVSGVAGKVNK